MLSDFISFSVMPAAAPPHDGSCPPTRWTLVWRARGLGEESFRASSELCAAYHYPLYCFARRRGLGPQDAEAATQDFFGSIIEQELFARADETRGRLRSFLLTGFFQWSLSRRRQAETRQKRDRQATVSLNSEIGEEERYRRELQRPKLPGTVGAFTPDSQRDCA